MNRNDNGNALQAILQVLQSIESKLDVQEQRSNALHSAADTTSCSSSPREPAVAGEAGFQCVPGYSPSHLAISRPSSPVHLGLVQTALGTKIPYSDIVFNTQDLATNPDAKFLSQLRHSIGDCCLLPDDTRLPIHLFNRFQDWKNNMMAPHYTSAFNLGEATKRSLSHLLRFDEELRKVPGNDFVIIDYDAAHNSRLYRIGEPAIGSEIMIDRNSPSHKQWSRLM